MKIAAIIMFGLFIIGGSFAVIDKRESDKANAEPLESSAPINAAAPPERPLPQDPNRPFYP